MGITTSGSQPEGQTSAPTWVKSSLSFSNGNCVEVAGLPRGEVGVRNSRDREGAVLRFTPDEWHAFIGGGRSGEFDSSSLNTLTPIRVLESWICHQFERSPALSDIWTSKRIPLP